MNDNKKLKGPAWEVLFKNQFSLDSAGKDVISLKVYV